MSVYRGMVIEVSTNPVPTWTPVVALLPLRIMDLLWILHHLIMIGQFCSPMRMIILTRASFTPVNLSSGILKLFNKFYFITFALCNAVRFLFAAVCFLDKDNICHNFNIAVRKGCSS